MKMEDKLSLLKVNKGRRAGRTGNVPPSIMKKNKLGKFRPQKIARGNWSRCVCAFHILLI